MSGTKPNFAHWRRLSTIKAWELAVLMNGCDPRALTDIVTPDGDGDLDYSVEERILVSAISAGILTAVPPTDQRPDRNTEVALTAAIEWLRAQGQSDLASNLAGTPVVLIEAIVDPRHRMHSPELRIAIETWADCVSTLDPEDSSASTKSMIERYLRDNYGQQLTESAISRLSTLLNPNKTGGRPRASDE